MTRTLSVFCITLLLASCGAPMEQWRHVTLSDTAPSRLLRDKADCQMYIDASRESSWIAVPRHPVFEWEEEFVQCMAERGWRLEQQP